MDGGPGKARANVITIESVLFYVKPIGYFKIYSTTDGVKGLRVDDRKKELFGKKEHVPFSYSFLEGIVCISVICKFPNTRYRNDCGKEGHNEIGLLRILNTQKATLPKGRAAFRSKFNLFLND